MNNQENKNGVVTLQIKLTRAEHNRATKAKGTEQTWVHFLMTAVDMLSMKKTLSGREQLPDDYAFTRAPNSSSDLEKTHGKTLKVTIKPKKGGMV